MAKRIWALAVLAIGIGACATEQRTVVVEQPRTAVVEPASESRLLAESQAACQAYGLASGTATFHRCVRDEFAARRPG